MDESTLERYKKAVDLYDETMAKKNAALGRSAMMSGIKARQDLIDSGKIDDATKKAYREWINNTTDFLDKSGSGKSKGMMEMLKDMNLEARKEILSRPNVAASIEKEFANLPKIIPAEIEKNVVTSHVKNYAKNVAPFAGPAMAAGEVVAGENDIGKMAAGLAGSEALGTLASMIPGGAVTKGILGATGAVAGYPLGQAAYEKLAPEGVKEALKLTPEERMKIKEMFTKLKNKKYEYPEGGKSYLMHSQFPK